MEKKYLYNLLIVGLCLVLGACNGYLDEIPQNKQKLSTTDDYDQLLNNAYLTKVVLPYIDVLTDDMDYIAADRDPGFANSSDTYLGAHLWDNSIETTMPNGDEAFENFYNSIFNTNVVIENIDHAVGDVLDETVVRQTRNHIKGEAYALRAFRYFYLVNMYASPYDPATCETAPGIPINLEITADDKVYRRSSLKVVYEQIVGDLEKAIPLLEENPINNGKTRFSAIAAKALLAKVYLYMKNYQEVINELTSVVADINAKRNLSLVPMPQTFPNNLKTSKDIIFAVQYLKGGVGESVHQNNRYRNNDNGNIISLEQAEFENNDDNRKALVAPTGSGQRPGKFDAPATNNETSADFPVMRCAEVMLMYAEAANELSAIPTQEALDALNAVRINANLMGKTLEELSTKEIFRQAVYKERRLELALECDRWFDIVRTGQMTTVFPGIAAYRQLYPIPQTEIENVSDKDGWQNEGYTVE